MSRPHQPSTPERRNRAQSRLRTLTRASVIAATGATAFIGVVVAGEHSGAAHSSANSGNATTSSSSGTTGSSSTGSTGDTGTTGNTGNTGTSSTSSAPTASTSTPSVTSGGTSR